MNVQSPFIIDEACSDHRCLYVDVAAIGTVAVMIEAEGLSVEVYPLPCAAAPIASLTVPRCNLAEHLKKGVEP